VDADRGGVCQPTGFCSFPDPSCESGQRYGAHAGERLAERCVVDGEGSSSGVTAAHETSTSLSQDDSSTTHAVATDTTTTTTTTTATGTETEATTEIEPPIDPDLVAWYRFDDLLDGIVEDSSPNRLHGTCESCPTSTPGAFGNAAAFDGVSQFIQLPSSSHFDLTEAFTITAWARLEDWPQSIRMLVCRPLGPENRNSWQLYASASTPATPRIHFYVADALDTYVGTGVEVSDPRAWLHVALIWDGSEATLYLDGEPGAQRSINEVAYDDHAPRIGADLDFGQDTNFFAGAIDDVRIYSRVLDAAEIAELAQPL
jgi:hypothetical protein